MAHAAILGSGWDTSQDRCRYTAGDLLRVLVLSMGGPRGHFTLWPSPLASLPSIGCAHGLSSLWSVRGSNYAWLTFVRSLSEAAVHVQGCCGCHGKHA
eukprot:8567453-Pyramimonas_sp.AAC.1